MPKRRLHPEAKTREIVERVAQRDKPYVRDFWVLSWWRPAPESPSGFMKRTRRCESYVEAQTEIDRLFHEGHGTFIDGIWARQEWEIAS